MNAIGLILAYLAFSVAFGILIGKCIKRINGRD